MISTSRESTRRRERQACRHAASTPPPENSRKISEPCTPSPGSLQLETVSSPREAFFARTEMAPGVHAAGRIAAEQLTPYPPGIPVVVPGERLDTEVIDYLQSGLRAGMAVPDATDASLECFRVMV